MNFAERRIRNGKTGIKKQIDKSRTPCETGGLCWRTGL